MLSAALLALLVIATDAWATSIVLRREPDAQLRARQLLLVWCMPVLGAVLVGLAHAKAPALTAGDRTAFQSNDDLRYTGHDRSSGSMAA